MGDDFMENARKKFENLFEGEHMDIRLINDRYKRGYLTPVEALVRRSAYFDTQRSILMWMLSHPPNTSFEFADVRRKFNLEKDLLSRQLLLLSKVGAVAILNLPDGQQYRVCMMSLRTMDLHHHSKH